MRRQIRSLCVVGCLLVLVSLSAACRVDATIDIDVSADGSGTVSVQAVFDQAASAALGGSDGLEDRLFVRDLAAAGWSITRPEVGANGTTTVRASKHVSSRDQFPAVLDEIAGPRVFRGARVHVEDGFAKRRQSLRFDLDLSDGFLLLSDDGVAAALDGEPFGAPIDDLTGGRTVDEIVSVQLNARVAGGDGAVPAAASYTPRFDADPTPVRVSAVVERTGAALLRWVAYALGSLFVLSLALAVTGLWLQRRADRLRPRTTPAKLTSRIPGERPASSPNRARTTARTRREEIGPVRLVVVEPLSVLFQQGEAPESYLLAFVRHNGGDERADVILDAFRQVRLGQIDTATFWKSTGIVGAGSATDDVFMEMRWLRKQAPSFLKELERRRIPVAAISNDALAWSTEGRDRDRLSTIWPWLVSAEVGALKPDPGMFEMLRHETGIAYGHCLYIDSDIHNLDAARELGMRTALYNADDLLLPEIVGHVVVSDLLQLVPQPYVPHR